MTTGADVVTLYMAGSRGGGLLPEPHIREGGMVLSLQIPAMLAVTGTWEAGIPLRHPKNMLVCLILNLSGLHAPAPQ